MTDYTDLLARLRMEAASDLTFSSPRLIARDALVVIEALEREVYIQGRTNNILARDLQAARDGWHQANGVADLAMKHRDIAEAEVERLRGLLREARAAIFKQAFEDDIIERIDATLGGAA